MLAIDIDERDLRLLPLSPERGLFPNNDGVLDVGSGVAPVRQHLRCDYAIEQQREPERGEEQSAVVDFYCAGEHAGETSDSLACDRERGEVPRGARSVILEDLRQLREER